MKRKILLSLLLLFAAFTAGGLVASIYVTRATDELHGLVRLHQIENLRRALVINVQSVQNDLYAVGTPLARTLDSIVAHGTNLARAASRCNSCHHPPELSNHLDELEALIEEYQSGLSYYVTARANRDRIQKIQLEVAAIGERILRNTEEMSLTASGTIEEMTLEASARIKRVRLILLATLVAALLLGLVVALHLTRSIVIPIQKLLEATRAIASGTLGHKISYEEKTEFGELARNFNKMSAALKEGYDKLQATNEELEGEIIERKRAEEGLRLNEFRLKSMLDLNQMADASLQEMAEFVLDRAVALTKSAIGFVGFVNDDGKVFLQHAVSASAMRRCEMVEKPIHFEVDQAGIWAEALREKAPFVVNDYSAPGLKKKGFPAGHVAISRLLSIPVLDRERVVGLAAVANKQGEYEETDIQQLTLLMQGMWQHVKRKKMEDELLGAQKLESIGVLAGGIAHDFNNLLTGILANVSLAERYVEPGAKAYKRLAEIEKACSRAQGLTQQLLTFSKGGAPLKQPTLIADLVRESVTFALSGANVKCEFDVTDEPCVTEVDPGQMSQVISNIILNAEQAMPQGGTIKVVCENVKLGEHEVSNLKPGKYVKISVADRGCGIAKADLPKIFDPYFTTKTTGHGLGLATSYSIVRQHGGHIAVETEAGAGTTFHLYIPSRARSKRNADAASSDAAILGVGSNGSSGRVLVMDDEEAIRDAAVEILIEAGFEAEVARNGHEAIELYRCAMESGRPYDVAIMDLTVPGAMGGLEALQGLREIDPGVKAIVTSGYSNDPAMADFAEHGFQSRISKPYKLDEFVGTVEEVLR